MARAQPDRAAILISARQSLAAFAIYITAGAFQAWAMHRHIVAHLLAVERGERRRLMIFAPPQHGKTWLTSILFVAWYLGRHPDRRVIFATYNDDRASDVGRALRRVMTSPLFLACFPACRLTARSARSDAATEIELEAGGSFQAASVDGSVTGRGAHLVVIDDPIKGRKQADSEAFRRQVVDFYADSARTRLQPGGAIILIATRWHEADLAGWLLERQRTGGESWEVVTLRAMAEDDDPLGRAVGEALCPERYPLAELEEIKAGTLDRTWASLYQQRPSPPLGQIILSEWFRPLSRAWRPEEFSMRWTYWDTKATKSTAESASYVAGGVWGKARGEPRYVLLEVAWRKAGFSDTLDMMRDVARRWPKWTTHVVEPKAAGPSIIETLERELPGFIADDASPDSKVARVEAIAPLWRAEQVEVDHEAAWFGDYRHEMVAFPSGAHDDQVDMTSGALRWALAHGADAEMPIVGPGGLVVRDWISQARR